MENNLWVTYGKMWRNHKNHATLLTCEFETRPLHTKRIYNTLKKLPTKEKKKSDDLFPPPPPFVEPI